MPTDSVEFHEEATPEYDAAFDWYLEQARTPLSSLTLKWIGHWSTSCKLLNDGRPARIPRVGFCSGNSLLS
jgi:hypothetical protein